jgi:hypothetical protein
MSPSCHHRLAWVPEAPDHRGPGTHPAQAPHTNRRWVKGRTTGDERSELALDGAEDRATSTPAGGCPHGRWRSGPTSQDRPSTQRAPVVSLPSETGGDTRPLRPGSSTSAATTSANTARFAALIVGTRPATRRMGQDRRGDIMGSGTSNCTACRPHSCCRADHSPRLNPSRCRHSAPSGSSFGTRLLCRHRWRCHHRTARESRRGA